MGTSVALPLRVFRRRNRIEPVRVLPFKFFPGRNVHLDVWLGRNHSPYCPHSQIRQRSIAVDIDTRSSFPVLHPDFIIRGGLAESRELSVKSVAALQIFRETQFFPAILCQTIESL